MQTYRAKLKLNITVLAVFIVILVAVQVLAFCQIITPVVPGNAHWADLWSGFITGAAFGLSLLFFIGLVQYVRALRSEKALKKLYVRENDERKTQIAIYGQSIGSRFFLCAMLPATIISGYFSVTVSLTCLVVTLVLGLSMVLGKLYYCKKF